MKLTNLTYQSYSLISAPKIHTDLLWDLTLLFVSIAVVYFMAIFFFKKRISKIARKTKQLKNEFSPMISEFIFLEADATKDEKSKNVSLKVEIRELLKNNFNRKTVAEILLDLRKDVSGSAQKQLFELYKDLGLHKASYKKLRSWRWETISQGIRELTKMQVAESYSFITRFINDKRGTIRKQAEIAVVTLKPEGLNYFLDTTKHRISEWQQLKLMEVLANKENYIPPSFKVWLTSKNKYVVLFALRLIKHYDQNDANTTIIELVKHKNNRIKREAIDCINSFHVTDALETLKTVFWKCTPDIKIAILDAIGNIGKKEDIDFLKLIENKEYSFSVRSKALAAINMISPDTIMPTEGILDTEGYEVPQDISSKKLEVMEPENSLDEYVEQPPEPIITNEEDSIPKKIEEVATEVIDQIAEKELPPMVSESEVLEMQKEDEPIEVADMIDQITETVTPSITGESVMPEIQQEDDTISNLSGFFEIVVVDATLVPNIIGPTNIEVTHHKPETPNEMEDTRPLDEDAEAQITDQEETAAFTIDCIPFVVDELAVQEHLPEFEAVSDALHFLEIPVVYEVVEVAANSVKEDAPENLQFDIAKADMYFIPVVVEDISVSTFPNKEDDLQEKIAPNALDVSFERVAQEKSPASSSQLDPKQLEVIFEEIRFEEPIISVTETPLQELSVTYETISIDIVEEKAKNQPMKALDPLKLAVIYEEVHGTPFNGCASLEELLEANILPSELSQGHQPTSIDVPKFTSLEEILEARRLPESLEKTIEVLPANRTEETTEPPKEQESALTEEREMLQEQEELLPVETEMPEELKEPVMTNATQENLVVEEEKIEEELKPNIENREVLKEEENIEEEEEKKEIPQELAEVISSDSIQENLVVEEEKIEGEEIEEIGTIELELTSLAEAIEIEDEIAEQELPNWLLKEIADPNVRTSGKEPIKTEGPEWKAKVPKMMDDIQYYLQYIPEPILYDSEVSETMQLLDDIEFFGDERELPLLEELMAMEKKEVAYERLQDIMARFRGNTQPKDNSIFKLTPPYSIFEKFFRHCDTESKLILLGEVTAVGDENEVYFLERLLEDPEPQIRAKASETLATLKERLALANPGAEKGQADKIYAESEKMTNSEYQQLLNEMQIKPPEESDIFEIDFELSPDGETYVDDVIRGVKETPDTRNSFLSIFRKLNSKSRPKRNG